MDPSSKKRKADENGIEQALKITPEDARKIISPFSPDQLLDILQDAVAHHPDVLDAVRSIADRDPAQRKLFIRGLGWDTTTEGLRTLFSSYGELEEAIVILDKATGKSKGYGFVTFKHIDGALLALKEPSKKIDGRMTVTQLAASGAAGPTANAPAPDVSMRKIFVGNVPADMPADRLLAHFSSYGEIEEGPLGFDKQTGKSRGFALFVYKTAEAARASLVDSIKNVDGHQLQCKLAIEGKKGKPGGPTEGVQLPSAGAGDISGNAVGLLPPSSMPGSLSSQYGGPGVPGGVSSFGGLGGFPAGHQGPGLSHHLNTGMQPSLGGPGLSSVGNQVPSSSMPGSLSSQYGGPGVPGGVSSFGGLGGFPAGHQGPGLSHHLNTGMQPSLGGPGLSSVGNQVPSSLGGGGSGYGSGLGGGGPYGSSQYGGPGMGGYGGSAGGPSMYRLPPSSVGMPSGSYPEGGHYGLSSSAYQSQHHQQAGSSPVPRVPTGGMYQGVHPYY